MQQVTLMAKNLWVLATIAIAVCILAALGLFMKSTASTQSTTTLPPMEHHALDQFDLFTFTNMKFDGVPYACDGSVVKLKAGTEVILTCDLRVNAGELIPTRRVSEFIPDRGVYDRGSNYADYVQPGKTFPSIGIGAESRVDRRIKVPTFFEFLVADTRDDGVSADCRAKLRIPKKTGEYNMSFGQALIPDEGELERMRVQGRFKTRPVIVLRFPIEIVD